MKTPKEQVYVSEGLDLFLAFLMVLNRPGARLGASIKNLEK